MHYRTLFVFFIALFLWSGCSQKKRFFILSTASNPIHIRANKHKVIGVEKVVVPKYLFKREIAISKSSSEILFLSNATWAEDLTDGLTNRLIGFLQKKFKQPNVYSYPWGLDTQPNYKVKLQIIRFIAQNGRVYLDANWSVETMKTGKKKSQLFHSSVATRMDATHIVASMDKAFAKLEENIARGIK